MGYLRFERKEPLIFGIVNIQKETTLVFWGIFEILKGVSLFLQEIIIVVVYWVLSI